jgi:hypothetical protein
MAMPFHGRDQLRGAAADRRARCVWVLNSISLGLTAAGTALVIVSLVLNGFSTGMVLLPYTELNFSPGVGPDLDLGAPAWPGWDRP